MSSHQRHVPTCHALLKLPVYFPISVPLSYYSVKYTLSCLPSQVHTCGPVAQQRTFNGPSSPCTRRHVVLNAMQMNCKLRKCGGNLIMQIPATASTFQFVPALCVALMLYMYVKFSLLKHSTSNIQCKGYRYIAFQQLFGKGKMITSVLSYLCKNNETSQFLFRNSGRIYFFSYLTGMLDMLYVSC